MSTKTQNLPSEIERKFLIKVSSRHLVGYQPSVSEIEQGYYIQPEQSGDSAKNVIHYPAPQLAMKDGKTCVIIPTYFGLEYVEIPEDHYKFLQENCTKGNTPLQRPLEIDLKKCAARIRIEEMDGREAATLCIKLPQSNIENKEFEYTIPHNMGIGALNLLTHRTSKTRYTFNLGSHTVQADYYKGENAPLARAEVEFKTQQEANAYKFPWDHVEVTKDKRYSDKQLAQNPYSIWKDCA